MNPKDDLISEQALGSRVAGEYPLSLVARARRLRISHGIVSMLQLMHVLTRRGRLLVAPYAALAVDAGVTLLLQSSDYWSGRYEAASEAEVIGAMTLRYHPLAFLAWIAVWAVALAIIIALVPRIIARITCVAAALLHTFGLLNWVLAWSSNLYVTYSCGLVSAALIVYSLEQKTDADKN